MNLNPHNHTNIASPPSLKTPPSASRGGFSLVELALALLVVSVGLISIIGLFPASLDMSKRAINETYATFLADSAIASFRESANYVPWDELDQFRPIAPNTISKGGVVNSDVFWKNSESLRMIADNTVRTLIFTAGSTPEKWGQSAGWVLPNSWSMEDHALRYRLRIEDIDPVSDPRIKRMVLEVWLGEFGNTANEKPEVFYAEIFRHQYVP